MLRRFQPPFPNRARDCFPASSGSRLALHDQPSQVGKMQLGRRATGPRPIDRTPTAGSPIIKNQRRSVGEWQGYNRVSSFSLPSSKFLKSVTNSQRIRGFKIRVAQIVGVHAKVRHAQTVPPAEILQASLTATMRPERSKIATLTAEPTVPRTSLS